MMKIIGYLLILGSFLFLFAGYQQFQRAAEQKRRRQVEEERWGEEGIAIEQANFERKIATQEGFPDWLSPRSVHIYRNLVSVWVADLVSNGSRSEDSLNDIRREFLRYMTNLEDKYRNQHLGLDVGETQDHYEKLAAEAARKVIAIENSFAIAMGKKAVNALAYARGRPENEFNSQGMAAPAGYRYEQRKLVKKDDDNAP